MPTYLYKTLTARGHVVTGEVTAHSEEEARRQLERDGFLVKGIRPKMSLVFFSRSGGVRSSDFLRYNQEIGTLLKAGLTVPEVLDIVSDRPESPNLSSALGQVLSDVKTGMTFSDACAKHPQVFDGLYLSSLKTGERTGNLVSPLARYQEHLRRRAALETKISQALVYPVFLVVVLIVILGFLFTFVMPRFAALYSDFNAVMPLPTRLLLGLVRHLYLVLLVGVPVLAGLWLSLKAWSSTPGGKLWWDETKESLPLASQITRPLLVAQLARTLSTLLSGGTPLVEALRVTGETTSNQAFRSRLELVTRRVADGEALSSALAAESLVPRDAVKLVQVGEASAQLEGMFQEIANAYELTVENRLQGAMALVEPAFILVSGLLIGTIIVIMYLPIIHLSDIVK